MFSFFGPKYTENEKQYSGQIKKILLSTGATQKESESNAKQMLGEAIKRAENSHLRGVETLGNKLIKDESYLNKRLKSGLTTEDVLGFYNRDYVWIIVEGTLGEAIRFSVYLTLTDEGKSSEEAVKHLRKIFIYVGDPENSHENYQGEDADIYPEFTARHEIWRGQISPVEEQSLANRYSTYNAMVRDLIRKGVI